MRQSGGGERWHQLGLLLLSFFAVGSIACGDASVPCQNGECTAFDAGHADGGTVAPSDAQVGDIADDFIDAQPLDAGVDDLGLRDSGIGDAETGAPDAGVVDAAIPDTGPIDVGPLPCQPGLIERIGLGGLVDILEPPSISADGRFVAFMTWASLLPQDTDPNALPGQTMDVYVYDQATAGLELVSVSSTGTKAVDSNLPNISPDGRFVSFTTGSENLVANDTNIESDIFVRDLWSKNTERVSVDSSGGQANGSSYRSAISENGQVVAFESRASNLVPNDTNNRFDIFVHDRISQTTTRVSVSSTGQQTVGSEDSRYPAMSADGSVIAFISAAENLAPGGTGGFTQVFVHDVKTHETIRASRGLSGEAANGYCEYPAVSGDGRFVAFVTNADNIVPDDTNGAIDLFVFDRITETSTRASLTVNGLEGEYDVSGYPSLSYDGRRIVFSSVGLGPSMAPTSRDLTLREMPNGPTRQLVIGTEPLYYQPSLSADGRFVAFVTNTQDLVPGDTDVVRDIFLLHICN